MSFSRRWLFGILILTLLVGCRSSRAFQPGPAPDFVLKDIAGNTHTLASLRGKPVMLDFWATWCGPYQISIPLVQRFYQAHKDLGLVVLGMNVDDDPSPVYAFVKHYQMTYPVIPTAESSVSEDYQIEGIPVFIFIDQEGRIVQRFEGFSPDMAEAWEYQFQQLTAKK